MKIKVFSSVALHEGKPAAYELNDLSDVYRVRVAYNDETYELSTAGGILELRHVEGKQLIVRPAASNLIYVEVDPWPPLKEKRRARDSQRSERSRTVGSIASRPKKSAPRRARLRQVQKGK